MNRDEIEKAAKEFLGTEYQVPDWLIDFALAMFERQANDIADEIAVVGHDWRGHDMHDKADAAQYLAKMIRAKVEK